MSAFGLSAKTFAAGLLSIGAGSAAMAGPVEYQVLDLGTLGGAYSQAADLNDHGQVVGWSATADGQVRGFRTSANRAIDPQNDNLGVYQLNDVSRAFGINNAGTVVGYSGTQVGDEHHGQQAFRRTAPTGPINHATDSVPEHFFPADQTQAVAINEAGAYVVNSRLHGIDTTLVRPDGQVVGISNTEFGHQVEVHRVYDINDDNQIAGASFFDQGVDGFVADGNQSPAPMRRISPKDPSTDSEGNVTFPRARVLALNNVGQMVGSEGHLVLTGDLKTEFDIVHTGIAFVAPIDGLVQEDGTLLGTLPGLEHSVAKDINDDGVIVGFSHDLVPYDRETDTGPFMINQRAFVYFDGIMYDLNEFVDLPNNWLLVTAEGINANGQITGNALVDGQYRAYLLSPFQDGHPPVIPLPAPLALGFAGLMGAGIVQRLRRPKHS